ncbi:MAG: hypothetical protein J7L23_04170 [Candidatus Diapherotrites archaeon]|nr:hypothetical protein [Candidatus Diapherotrites archaeon]
MKPPVVVLILGLIVIAAVVGIVAYTTLSNNEGSGLDIAVYDRWSLHSLNGTKVQLYDLNQNLIAEANTDDRGVAHFNVSSGSYFVYAKAPGYEEQWENLSVSQGIAQMVDVGLEQVVSCEENWTCGDYGECVNGIQTRNCTDLNDCGTTYKKPNEVANCTVQVCSSDSDCDDGNPCTEDKCNNKTSCLHTAVSKCKSGDGCCPSGCNYIIDKDCRQCKSSSDCNDNNDCTIDLCVKGFCQISWPHCGDNDGCCPPGCTHSEDSDCSGGTGCSSSSDCNDNNPCTSDSCDGGDCKHHSLADGTSCGTGKICCSGKCSSPACSKSSDCGTNTSCTTYTCSNPDTCSAKCNEVTKDCSDCSCSCGDYTSTGNEADVSCTDDIDNDCDSFVDCDDSDCAGNPACGGTCTSDGGTCTQDSDCCSGKCDSETGKCFSCASCSGVSACSNQETNECESQCGASQECDDKQVDSTGISGNTCYICSDCTYSGDTTVGSCTCGATNCANGYCGAGTTCYYGVTCSIGQWNYTNTCSTADSCGTNTLITGKTCSASGCSAGTTYTCSSSSHTNCQSKSCGGKTYYCTYDGSSWAWRTSKPEESIAAGNCNDGVDNDCNGKTDPSDPGCFDADIYCNETCTNKDCFSGRCQSDGASIACRCSSQAAGWGQSYYGDTCFFEGNTPLIILCNPENSIADNLCKQKDSSKPYCVCVDIVDGPRPPPE